MKYYILSKDPDHKEKWHCSPNWSSSVQQALTQQGKTKSKTKEQSLLNCNLINQAYLLSELRSLTTCQTHGNLFQPKPLLSSLIHSSKHNQPAVHMIRKQRKQGNSCKLRKQEELLIQDSPQKSSNRETHGRFKTRRTIIRKQENETLISEQLLPQVSSTYRAFLDLQPKKGS